jgi:hypothetical protein
MLTISPRPAVPKLLLALPAVLALFALLLLPAVARAEPSGEVVYHEGPAGLESVGPGRFDKSKAKAEHHVRAHRHVEPTTGEPAPDEMATEPGVRREPEGESGPEGNHKARVTPTGKGGNHPPGPNGTPPKTSPGTGSSKTSVSSEREVATPKRVEAAGSGGGGGSSPVVPILIAMALLAALSVGVVLYRERRGDDGPDGLNPPV